MNKYYTRACNFYFGSTSKKNIKKKISIPLNGNPLISFDKVEIINRKNSKIINIKDIDKLPKNKKIKIKKDLKKIKQKKTFKRLALSDVPILMGIVNLTPDSFSDGGKYNNKSLALKHIKNLLSNGAKILDIGGESTRPGASDVSPTKEWDRIKTVLKILKNRKCFVSLDTRKSFVMEKASKIKVDLINDVSGLDYDPQTINFLKKTGKPFIIHHMKGTPKSMQIKPSYKNVLLDIYDFFENKIDGVIKDKKIILDPGIGFGKTLKHNLTLISKISLFHSLGFPILVGTSRKRFINQISKTYDSKERIGGTLASILFLLMQGVQIFRVHNVNEVKQGILIFKEILKQ